MKRARYDVDVNTPEITDHVTPNTRMGGRAPPGVVKVSKKIQACTACQSRKIKCDLPQGGSICTRCSKKGLKCTVNRSLQSILTDEAEWKTGMERTSQQLQGAVSELLRVLDLPSLESFGSVSQTRSVEQERNSGLDVPVGGQRNVSTPVTGEQSNQTPRTMAMTRENSNEPENAQEDNNTLVSAPMGTLYEVTKLRHLRGHQRRHHHIMITPLESDFISRGMITENEAQELFIIFNQSLNHYLWGGIALVHLDLASVRRSSSLLLAAILTVTALHIPGKTATFDVCYSEFLSLVSSSMLDRYHTLDGVRGLCIGAFWLSDLSWKLSGHAVRIATELNLHQSYAKAIRGALEHIEGARLWYFLYVCDHHFSIAYGRPPVIHADGAIVAHERFLQLPGISQADFRLHSQVAIFIILTRMYHIFGPDIEQMLKENEIDLLQEFNLSLDNWRTRWESQLTPNPYISSYPAKGVLLHYHFAKLQLNSLTLRGFQELNSQDLSAARREYANLAISSAISILRLVVGEPDIRNGLVGVPLYLHTMITYAAVFLLKVQQKWKSLRLGTDSILIRDLVEQIINLLKSVKAGERHLTYHIANGLSRMLDRSSGDVRNLSVSDKTSSIGNAGASNGVPMYDIDYAPFAMFGDSMDMFDEHYFPLGFFDVTAISGVEPCQH